MSEEATTTVTAENVGTSSESPNPNVAVDNIDESTTHHQNNFSFNEIEQALKQREQNKGQKAKQAPDKGVESSKKVDPKAEKEKKGKEEKETAEEKAEKKAEKEIKKLKAKYGEDIFELHPETLIPHKVDGKVEEIPVKELLNSYAGKVAYDKRFQELDVEKKTYAKEKQEWAAKTKEIDSFVTEFFTKAQSGQAMEALQMLAAGVGQDPLEFTRNIKASILREYETYANMTEEERRKHDVQQEVEYYERQIAQKKEKFTQYQEREVEMKNIEKFCANYNVSFEQFEQTYNNLVQSLIDQGVNPQTLRVQDVEKYYVDNIAYSAASNSLGNLRPEWQNRAEIVEIVANYVRNNMNATPAMIDAYVMQTFDIKPSKSVAQVLKHESRDAESVSTGLQKKVSVPKRPMFFSEL